MLGLWEQSFLQKCIRWYRIFIFSYNLIQILFHCALRLTAQSGHWLQHSGLSWIVLLLYAEALYQQPVEIACLIVPFSHAAKFATSFSLMTKSKRHCVWSCLSPDQCSSPASWTQMISHEDGVKLCLADCLELLICTHSREPQILQMSPWVIWTRKGLGSGFSLLVEDKTVLLREQTFSWFFNAFCNSCLVHA